MPVSDVRNIAPILSEVVRLQPKRIIDLGIGFGKYGVLCREVLDAVRGYTVRNAATTYIEGIEAFPKYRNPAWEVYDLVRIGDFTTCRDVLQGWDLVLMIDSLEHLEKDAAKDFLKHLVTHNKQVIVSVPVGVCPQGDVFGNKYERHRSEWYGVVEFAGYTHRLLHHGTCCVVSITGEGK